MRIKCPACGAVGSLDLLLAAEEGAAEMVELAGNMERSVWKLAIQYLGLFRPAKGKLSWPRAVKILGELDGMVKAAEFERGGVKYHAPLNYWLAGLEQILAQRANINRQLTTHGYLLEIMMSIDAKSVGPAEKPPPAERPERRHDPPPTPMPPEDVMSKAEAQAAHAELMRNLKAKLKGSGVRKEPAPVQETGPRLSTEYLERIAAGLNEEMTDE